MSEKCLLLWDFARRVHDFNKGKFLPDIFGNPVKRALRSIAPGIIAVMGRE